MYVPLPIEDNDLKYLDGLERNKLREISEEVAKELDLEVNNIGVFPKLFYNTEFNAYAVLDQNIVPKGQLKTNDKMKKIFKNLYFIGDEDRKYLKTYLYLNILANLGKEKYRVLRDFYLHSRITVFPIVSTYRFYVYGLTTGRIKDSDFFDEIEIDEKTRRCLDEILKKEDQNLYWYFLYSKSNLGSKFAEKIRDDKNIEILDKINKIYEKLNKRLNEEPYFRFSLDILQDNNYFASNPFFYVVSHNYGIKPLDTSKIIDPKKLKIAMKKESLLTLLAAQDTYSLFLPEDNIIVYKITFNNKPLFFTINNQDPIEKRLIDAFAYSLYLTDFDKFTYDLKYKLKDYFKYKSQYL